MQKHKDLKWKLNDMADEAAGKGVMVKSNKRAEYYFGMEAAYRNAVKLLDKGFK